MTDSRPAVVLRADSGLLACGVLLYGFFGVVCLIFGALLCSAGMAAVSLLFFLPALAAGLWFSGWSVSFFPDRVEVRTLLEERTYPWAGMTAEIRRRPGPRVRGGVLPLRPLVTFRRGGQVVLDISESQAGERRAELLDFLRTLDIPRRYLN